MGFLDNTGLAYLWSQLKNKFVPKSGGSFTGDVGVSGNLTAETAQFSGDVTCDGAINTTPSGVSSPALAGDLSHTGDYIEQNPSNINVSTATWTTVASITLSPGKWLVWYTVRFNDTSYNSGKRLSLMSASNTEATSIAVMMEDAKTTTQDHSTYCKAIDVWERKTTSTHYLRVYQNSGSTINTTARLHALRIC